MKNILKIFAAFILVTGLWSCQKDEKKVIFEGGTQPVLSTALSGQVPLSYPTQGNQAFKISWTNPDYKFNTGVSSMDVNYNILIDKSDKFDSPDMKTISVGTDLSKTFSQSEFNDILLNQLQLDTTAASPVYIRVDAFLTGGAEQVSSNALTISAKPYSIPPKVAPPSSGNLFIVGSATPGGWDNPMSVDPKTQQFTQETPTLYTLVIKLTGAGEYKFIAVNGSWDQQWSIAKADDASEVNGGDFVFNGANILAPSATGMYKITVDFQRGKFTVTPQ